MSTNETGRSKKDKTTSIFSRKVDSTKVNLPVIKRWIEEEITAQIPDDDIAAGFIYELIAGEENPDINAIRAQTDDFLGPKESKIFCKKLWKHLLSAQGDKDGLPSELQNFKKVSFKTETVVGIIETGERGMARETAFRSVDRGDLIEILEQVTTHGKL
ncbi:hypothetical protein CA7LBN_003166 [Candidozyma auris]|uniref:U1 small nuclear ribonucleoprotein component SNU71 n=1 Tax=Candidozyma auris TaxID=498019 RepID=A0A8F2W3W5_CANAR|nr:hypothetical protein CA7LBN_003166 [[Candida] auris]